MDKFKAHILMVDDDDRIRELVKQYLNENNYLVTTANSAEQAKEKISYQQILGEKYILKLKRIAAKFILTQQKLLKKI